MARLQWSTTRIQTPIASAGTLLLLSKMDMQACADRRMVALDYLYRQWRLEQHMGRSKHTFTENVIAAIVIDFPSPSIF